MFGLRGLEFTFDGRALAFQLRITFGGRGGLQSLAAVGFAQCFVLGNQRAKLMFFIGHFPFQLAQGRLLAFNLVGHVDDLLPQSAQLAPTRDQTGRRMPGSDEQRAVGGHLLSAPRHEAQPTASRFG